MGYWNGSYSNKSTWRKTPTKVGKSWHTPSGERVKNPDAYFKTVEKNGRYWKGNTGWSPKNRKYH